MTHHVQDPVCGMTVSPGKTHFKSKYWGEAYYFCSAACQRTFDEAPATYASAGKQARGASG